MSGDNLSVYKHPVSNEKVTGQNHSKNNRLPKRFLKTRQRERGQSHESTFKMKMNTTANSDKRGENRVRPRFFDQVGHETIEHLICNHFSSSRKVVRE